MGYLQVPGRYSDYLIVGEFGLSGQLRPVAGALAIALLAKDLGKKGLILPAGIPKEWIKRLKKF